MQCETQDPAFVHITDDCSHCIMDDGCNFITNLSSIDNTSLKIIDTVIEITNNISELYKEECVEVSHAAMVYDIGHRFEKTSKLSKNQLLRSRFGKGLALKINGLRVIE